MKPSAYYDPESLQRAVAGGRHREAVGGLWEELGALQLDFLINHGLQAGHTLLDIGCGSLRLGVKAVDFLDAGHYFGLDLSEDLIEAGYRRELTDAQRQKLPRGNLAASDDFDFSFLARPVDVAMAQSVFTHLPLNHIRHCLIKLTPHVKPGGYFFATAFLIPDAHPADEPYRQSGVLEGEPIVTTGLADPYHYYLRDFSYAIEGLPWKLTRLGDWGHPRGQQMLAFHR